MTNDESAGGMGTWVRESVSPIVLNLLVWGLVAVVGYDVYTAFGDPQTDGFEHLGAALLPGVILVYIVLKTSGRLKVTTGALAVVVAAVCAAGGYFLGHLFRPSHESVLNVLTMSGSAAVLLLLRERTEGELVHDVGYGVLVGLLIHLAFG